MTSVSNPIIPGFAPDPSIIRVGDTYFLVNSSFHLFPGLPIYSSTDLATWTHVGNAINRPSQLDLARSVTWIHRGSSDILVGTGGLYAPTIRHHAGTTYIICTNVVHPVPQPVDGERPLFRNFIVRTRDPSLTSWSDPVFFDFNGIDPDLFFDIDGRAYVVGSSWNTIPSTINGFEIDIVTGARLTPEVVIWGGALRVIPEGPHLYRRGNWYYLVIAEGGTHEDHQVSIARARAPLGPYESCARNPILAPTAGLADAKVVYTGHGDFVQNADDGWWFTCLGVRALDTADGRTSIMGRETFLARATWTDDDEDPWPVLEQPITLSVTLPSIPSPPQPLSSAPGIDWVHIRNPDLAAYHIFPDSHTISLLPSAAGLDNPGNSPVTFAGKRQRALTGSSEVSLSLPRRGQVGLAYYKDEHRHASIAYDAAEAAFVFEAVNAAKRQPFAVRKIYPVAGAGEAHFRILYTEREIRYYYRRSAAVDEWSEAGVMPTEVLTDHDFTGPCIGLFATTGTSQQDEEVEWCDFYNVRLL